MSLISRSERAEYRNALEMHGYAESDFELLEFADPHVAAEIVYRGTIVLKHTRTSVAKMYPVGFGSRWVAYFQDDLERHAFHAT
jgi:hypothetical protein